MTERCPFCRRGRKVEATYVLKDTTIEKDCSYCGFCGRNWKPDPQRDVKRAASGERDDA